MKPFLIESWNKTNLPEGLDRLRVRATQEGYRFLARMESECGINGIFRAPTSCLFLVRQERELVGIGGLTADPYDNATDILRVRHVFVDPLYRRTGAGRALALAIIEAAKDRVKHLTLRAPDDRAARFWQSVGFLAVDHPTRSHEMNLSERPQPPLQPAR